MNITTRQAQEYKIDGSAALDPVRFVIEDEGPGQGRITIWCWDRAWTARWNAMGERPLSQFFQDCDADYLARNLENGISTKVKASYGRRLVSNEKYEHLCKIIAAVQTALAQLPQADAPKMRPIKFARDMPTDQLPQNLARGIQKFLFWHADGEFIDEITEVTHRYRMPAEPTAGEWLANGFLHFAPVPRAHELEEIEVVE